MQADARRGAPSPDSWPGHGTRGTELPTNGDLGARGARRFNSPAALGVGIAQQDGRTAAQRREETGERWGHRADGQRNDIGEKAGSETSRGPGREERDRAARPTLSDPRIGGADANPRTAEAWQTRPAAAPATRGERLVQAMQPETGGLVQAEARRPPPVHGSSGDEPELQARITHLGRCSARDATVRARRAQGGRCREGDTQRRQLSTRLPPSRGVAGHLDDLRSAAPREGRKAPPERAGFHERDPGNRDPLGPSRGSATLWRAVALPREGHLPPAPGRARGHRPGATRGRVCATALPARARTHKQALPRARLSPRPALPQGRPSAGAWRACRAERGHGGSRRSFAD